jgi:hypothetical protein
LSFKFDYRVLSERLRTKAICGSDNSMIKNDTFPYRYRPQKLLTPGGREGTHLQNNIKPKPDQLKLSKADLSMWS